MSSLNIFALFTQQPQFTTDILRITVAAKTKLRPTGCLEEGHRTKCARFHLGKRPFACGVNSQGEETPIAEWQNGSRFH